MLLALESKLLPGAGLAVFDRLVLGDPDPLDVDVGLGDEVAVAGILG
jgi:hypothetical protein